MHSLAFGKTIHNSKLLFSKKELSKILSCYSMGVSQGSWKDYAINYNKYEANFFIFKHSLAAPDCVLTKSIKSKTIIIFNLDLGNKKNNKFYKIDDLLVVLKRKNLKII